MKKSTILYLFTILILGLSACSTTEREVLTSQPVINLADSPASVQSSESITSAPIISDYDSDGLTAEVTDDNATGIRLNGDSIEVEGSGVNVSGTIATITAAGVYNIQGTLADGQIIVDTKDEETVILILNGAVISSMTSAPIYIANAEKTIISLADGTENYITDGNSYVFENAESDEPNAAIFSKDDLTITGTGSLTVNGNYNNGIASKDGLKITGGTIVVNAVNDGIKGKDSVSVLDGVITIVAGSDGLQASNDGDIEKGYIVIDGGKFNITAGADGIQAESKLSINAGEFIINTGGGSVNAFEGDATKSAKGMKAGVDITIIDGRFEIDAADDALHSDGSLIIDGGEFMLMSGDDGIHSDDTLTINGGKVSILQSYEGLESGVITINDGHVHIVSSDDGINTASDSGSDRGVDGSTLYINGGYVFINADGDGLDVNGTAFMTGGVVIVQGTTFRGNGPLDFNGEFEISGGFLVAVGSAGMPETPSTSSTQNSIALILDATQPGGLLIYVESESGEEILTFEAAKEFQLFVFSSPELQTSKTYTVSIGGESTGIAIDGLYTDEIYSGGTEIAGFEITTSLTTVGSFENGFGGGGPPGGGGGPNGPRP